MFGEELADRHHISTTLTESEIETLFDHRYRRYLLYYLHLYANPVRLPDIAHQITIWETTVPADEHLQERLRIYTALYHDHLPPLRECGAVAYEQADDMVELGPAAAALAPTVERRLRADVGELLQAERCTFE